MASYTNNPSLQLRGSPGVGPVKYIFVFLLLKPFKAVCVLLGFLVFLGFF